MIRALELKQSMGRIERLWVAFERARGQRVRNELIRNELIEVYMPLVRGVAARLSRRLPQHVDVEDLVSAGVFGLVNAIEHFDHERGIKFETYCRKRVSGSMLDELRRQDWIPREARERADLLRRTVSSLRCALGREPDDVEAADAMGLSLRAYHDTLQDLAFASRQQLDPQASKGSEDDGQKARM